MAKSSKQSRQKRRTHSDSSSPLLAGLLAIVCTLAMAGFYACGMWKESRTPAPVQILSLDVTLELHRENRVTATELITVAVPQKGRHAGILRTVPVANPSALRREDAPSLRSARHCSTAPPAGRHCRPRSVPRMWLSFSSPRGAG